MNKLVAYKCFECGHYIISKYDGARCPKCNGTLLRPMGDATCIDKVNALKVGVSVKDTKLFEKMIKVFLTLVDDPYTPNWIKIKIQELILKEM